jgi:hypothetical protein
MKTLFRPFIQISKQYSFGKDIHLLWRWKIRVIWQRHYSLDDTRNLQFPHILLCLPFGLRGEALLLSWRQQWSHTNEGLDLFFDEESLVLHATVRPKKCSETPRRPLHTTKAAASLINVMSEISESSVASLGHSGQQWLKDLSKNAVVGSTERGTMLYSSYYLGKARSSPTRRTAMVRRHYSGQLMPGQPEGYSARSSTALVRSWERAWGRN